MKLSVKCRAGLQPRGTSWRGRNGLTGTSWRAVKGNPVSCHWGGITIGYNQYSLRANQQKSNSTEKDLGWKTRSQQCAESPLHIRLQGEDQCPPAAWGDPSLQDWWDTSGVLGPGLGSPVQGRKGHPGGTSVNIHPEGGAHWSTQCMKKHWGKGGLVGLEEKGSEISLQTSTSKMRGIEKPEPGGSGSYKAKGQGTPELKQTKFRLCIRESLFAMKVIKHCKRKPEDMWVIITPAGIQNSTRCSSEQFPEILHLS